VQPQPARTSDAFRRPDSWEMPALLVVQSRPFRVSEHPHRPQGPLSLITLNIRGGSVRAIVKEQEIDHAAINLELAAATLAGVQPGAPGLSGGRPR